MSKDLHNMDEIFNSAYKQLSEDPSPGVWEKINSGLDKKDASSYKRKSNNWRRVAIFSLLLLTGSILYEVVIVKTGPRSSDAIPTAVTTIKPRPKDETIDRPHNLHRAPNQENNTAASNKTEKITLSSANNLPLTPVRYDNEFLKTRTHTLTDNVPITSGAIARSVTVQHSPQVQPIYLKIIGDSRSGKSQSTNKSTPDINRFQPYWAISAFVSSDHPGYRLDKDGPTIVKIKQHEEHQSSYSAGILIARQVKNRVALQSGLIFSNIGIAISPEQIYASPNATGHVLYKYVVSSGYAYIKPGFASVPSPGDSLTAEGAQHSLQYLIVPLTVKYNLIKSHRFVLSPGLGIAGNFLTSAKIETDVTGSVYREHMSIKKLDGIRSFNWSVMGDIALEYLANKRMSLDLHPFFSYALSPITSKNDVATFPYNIGIGAGVTYRF